jgi:hypothetical protein
MTDVCQHLLGPMSLALHYAQDCVASTNNRIRSQTLFVLQHQGPPLELSGIVHSLDKALSL